MLPGPRETLCVEVGMRRQTWLNLALELLAVERAPGISNNPKFDANPHLHVNEPCPNRGHRVDRDRLLGDCWDKEQAKARVTRCSAPLFCFCLPAAAEAPVQRTQGVHTHTFRRKGPLPMRTEKGGAPSNGAAALERGGWRWKAQLFLVVSLLRPVACASGLTSLHSLVT